MNEWPGPFSDIKVVSMGKVEYLKMGKITKTDHKEILAIEENGDYQILVKDENIKIVFTQPGTAATFSQKTSAIVVEISSHRIKSFINSIIPKQGNFIIEYCSKQAKQSLRASTFKKISYQIWNIETIIGLRDWLQS